MDKNPFKLTEQPVFWLLQLRDTFAARFPRIYRLLAIALAEIFRAWPLLIFFAITFWWTSTEAPAKVGLTIYGLSKIAAGGYLGYRMDRAIFPYARPNKLEGIAAGTAQKRRAGIIMACIIAAGLIP